jgi:radical SAM protein with 4Fe4S-binding SPASM domain
MGNDKYIPVNKGHFDLDTPERIKSFSDKMAFGWVKNEYMAYRNAWTNYPPQRILNNYPLQVDIEMSSICNLSCPMCYTTTDGFKQKVKRKFIDFELFKKIVDEVAGNIYALRLSWRGESSLHPNFIDAIKYAKESGIKEVSFLTNGSTLELNYFVEMVQAGADWITISVDGTGEKYEQIRKPLKFADTLRKIKDAYQYKVDNNLVKPVIKVQAIWPSIKEDPEGYYNTLAPFVDLVAFNPIIDYLGKDHDIVYEDNFSCPQLYERLFVSSDGEVMMCNSDEYGKNIIGNAYKQTIAEIWNSDILNGIRELHKKKNGFLGMAICRDCFYPRKTVPNEKAMVNGQEIIVENYINRKQEIGA